MTKLDKPTRMRVTFTDGDWFSLPNIVEYGLADNGDYYLLDKDGFTHGFLKEVVVGVFPDEKWSM